MDEKGLKASRELIVIAEAAAKRRGNPLPPWSMPELPGDNSPGTIEATVAGVTCHVHYATTSGGDTRLAAMVLNPEGKVVGHLRPSNGGAVAVVKVLFDGSEAVVKWVDKLQDGLHFLQWEARDWQGQSNVQLAVEKPSIVFARLKGRLDELRAIATAVEKDAVALSGAAKARREAAVDKPKRTDGPPHMKPRHRVANVLTSAFAVNREVGFLFENMDKLGELVGKRGETA